MFMYFVWFYIWLISGISCIVWFKYKFLNFPYPSSIGISKDTTQNVLFLKFTPVYLMVSHTGNHKTNSRYTERYWVIEFQLKFYLFTWKIKNCWRQYVNLIALFSCFWLILHTQKGKLLWLFLMLNW